LLVGSVAGGFGWISFWADNVQTYLSSRGVDLLFMVVSAMSDVFADSAQDRSDTAFDHWCGAGGT
jgi:hypothetical protein